MKTGEYITHYYCGDDFKLEIGDPEERITRCRDCRFTHYDNDGNLFCILWNEVVPDYGFCFYGNGKDK